jgi:methylmalonyl-CoA epimerase
MEIKVLKKIDHIGIAVKSIAEAKELYKDIFQIEPAFEEEVQDQKVKVLGIRISESNLEYLEPTTPDSPIAKFLEKRGEGLHHIAISVSNLPEVLKMMIARNIRLIDENPRIGAEGKQIAFVHPQSMNGILLELIEEK